MKLNSPDGIVLTALHYKQHTFQRGQQVMALTNVAIIGAGIQGSMITFRNAIHGKHVSLFDKSEESITKTLSKIDAWLDHYVEKEYLTKQKADDSKSYITVTQDMKSAVADADLIIESVPEHLSLKQDVWEELDQLAPEKTLLATNSSSLKVSDINVKVNRKEKTFNVNHDDPIRNNLVEMMWNEQTAETTKELATAYFHTINYDPIITEKEIKGFSMNRVWRAVKKEALFLWANGYTTPEKLDRAWILEWDTDYGPFQYMDMVGLDTIYHIEMTYYEDSGDESDKPPQALKDMVDAGNLGMKTGTGFYEGYDVEKGNLV